MTLYENKKQRQLQRKPNRNYQKCEKNDGKIKKNKLLTLRCTKKGAKHQSLHKDKNEIK